jgi:hypothetical protein
VTPAQRRADALGRVAECALAGDLDAIIAAILSRVSGGADLGIEVLSGTRPPRARLSDGTDGRRAADHAADDLRFSAGDSAEGWDRNVAALPPEEEEEGDAP